MASPVRYDPEEARALIAERAMGEGALLPILHALQERYGHLPQAALKPVAEALNLSQADVYGVVTFYHDFREAPVDGRVLKLCRAEACQAAGCETLVERLAHRHGLKLDEGAGPLRVETVYCLGNCALGPAALLEGDPIGRLDPERLDAIVAEAGS